MLICVLPALFLSAIVIIPLSERTTIDWLSGLG
jgi:hypothetical protein